VICVMLWILRYCAKWVAFRNLAWEGSVERCGREGRVQVEVEVQAMVSFSGWEAPSCSLVSSVAMCPPSSVRF
jgi:hypothetical protein